MFQIEDEGRQPDVTLADIQAVLEGDSPFDIFKLGLPQHLGQQRQPQDRQADIEEGLAFLTVRLQL